MAKCWLSVGKTRPKIRQLSWIVLDLPPSEHFNFWNACTSTWRKQRQNQYVDAFWWGKQQWCLAFSWIVKCCFILILIVLHCVVVADCCVFISVFLFLVAECCRYIYVIYIYLIWYIYILVIVSVDFVVVIVVFVGCWLLVVGCWLLVVVVVVVVVVNSKWDYHTYYCICTYMYSPLLFKCIHALHYRLIFVRVGCKLQQLLLASLDIDADFEANPNHI